MAITKLSNSGIATGGVLKYDSMLAGNSPFIPGSYESIASTLVTSGTGAGDITFTSIPSTYKDLQIRCHVPSVPTTSTSLMLRVGTGSIDTGANYTFHALYGYGNNGNGVITRTSENVIEVHFVPQGTGQPFVGVIDILDYANTNKNKPIRSLFGHENNSNNTSQSQIWFTGGTWRVNTAINQFQFYYGGGNLPQNTRVSLYGIKAAS